MLNLCAQKLADYLTEKELNFHSGTDKDGDSVIEFPYQGKVLKMFFSGDEGKYLSMYLVYERVPEDNVTKTILTCNELNNQYKWVTFYVDKDNDVVLHHDSLLSTADAADESFEMLLRMLKISEDEKPRIMKAIYG